MIKLDYFRSKHSIIQSKKMSPEDEMVNSSCKQNSNEACITIEFIVLLQLLLRII